MDLQLQGKRALVTGSTLDIGFAVALGLAREGAQVVINGRTQTRVDQAADQIRAQVPGAIVTAVAADLSGAAGCAALIRELPDLDVLVNSLGIFEPKPFGEISDADWLRFFETNVEKEFFDTARPSSLLRRFATVEEVANMIVYLCGAGASATNGAALRVDGGVVRAIL